MKHIFAGVLLLSTLSLPASASSIEVIDSMVTGPKGSPSIITLGPVAPCSDAACVDATGGDPKLNTASAMQQIASVTTLAKKINFDFARKFPDPAVPVPSAPAEGEASAPAVPKIPTAPADSGTIAAQPPVQPQPDSASMGAPSEGAPADATRGAIDPNAPKLPITSTELREGE